MNTPISFEISKVLKEKGFDNPTLQWYHRDTKKLNTNDLMFSMNKLTDNYSAPTIVEVVIWLYEKHGIWVCIDKAEDFNWRKFSIRKLNDIGYERIGFGSDFKSPKEAYKAGIEYTLKNLIK